MMCRDLKKGMLVTIRSGTQRGWFHLRSHERYTRKYGKNAPPKFVVGPESVSFMMLLNGAQKIYQPGECYIYLGEEKFYSKDGRTRTFRLFLVGGQVGFIEGGHIKYLEPV